MCDIHEHHTWVAGMWVFEGGKPPLVVSWRNIPMRCFMSRSSWERVTTPCNWKTPSAFGRIPESSQRRHAGVTSIAAVHMLQALH
jgi:hypothetical protein